MTHETKTDRYLKPNEAADILKVHPNTLAKMRIIGEGPAYGRIGRAIRYRRSDLDAYTFKTRPDNVKRPK